MTNRIYRMLLAGEMDPKAIHNEWNTVYRDSPDNSATAILQLCVDMCGYQYELSATDLRLLPTPESFVQQQILVAKFQQPNFYANASFRKRLKEWLALLVVHYREQLLMDNDWLNRTVQLLVALCGTELGECIMAATYISSLLLQHLSTLLDYLQQGTERSNRWDSSSDEQQESRESYFQKICRKLMDLLPKGYKYEKVLPLLVENVCNLLLSFHELYIVKYNALHLLNDMLQYRHASSFGKVVTCLKKLLSKQFPVPVHGAICQFISSSGLPLMRGSQTFKSHGSAAMKLLLQAQSCSNAVNSIFDDATTQLILLEMFSECSAMRRDAIEFHNHCAEGNKHVMLTEIIKLFVTYEFPEESLRPIVSDLYRAQFFDDFSRLFNLLLAETGENGVSLEAVTISLIINMCYDALMASIDDAVQPDHGERSSWTAVQQTLRSFVNGYPTCLSGVKEFPRIRTVLLRCATSTHHSQLLLAEVNCEQYYSALFVVLEELAANSKDFEMLQSTLLVIKSYDHVVIDVEEIWRNLKTKFFERFFMCRSYFTSENMGVNMQLTWDYATAIEHLCLLMELDNEINESVALAMAYLDNDILLWDRIKFSDDERTIFLRLYKNIIYVVVQHYASNDRAVNVSESLLEFNSKRKGSIQRAVKILLKRVLDEDLSCNTSWHTAITVCDMLLITQPSTVPSRLPNITFSVNPDALDRLGRFILHYVFKKDYTDEFNGLERQQQMLVKYIDFYRLHRSLPQLTETRYILCQLGTKTNFTEQIEQLMRVLHQKDAVGFYATITETLYYCQRVYKTRASIEKIIKKVLDFLPKELVLDKGNVIFDLTVHIVDYILTGKPTSAANETAHTVQMLTVLQRYIGNMTSAQRATILKSIKEHPRYRSVPVNGNDTEGLNEFLLHLKQ